MSDADAQPDAEQTEPTSDKESTTEAQEAKTFDESYVKKLREEAAGYRTRLKEIEDSQKTEAEKQAERLAELDAKVKEYEAEKQITKWQSEVEKATGVPAAFLTASTKEGMEAQAEKAKPLIANGSTRPVRDIEKTPSAGQADPNEWLREMARG